jgi:2-polyprenyl-6-methoxyphenol hydroxylase-like FAD-dependent oxidoreductase
MGPFDVIVVGAGPAGATAANLLARAGQSVALLDACTFSRDARCAGWLNARALPLLKQLELSPEDMGARPFGTVTFYTADLARTVAPRFKSVPGFAVDRRRMDQALVRAAAAAGARVHAQHRVIDIIPREREVEVIVADRPSLRGRMALIACGRQAPAFERLGIGRSPEPPRLWSAMRQWPIADCPAPGPTVVPHASRPSAKGAGLKGHATSRAAMCSASVSVILGLTRTGGFAVLVESEQGLNLAVYSRESEQELASELASLCTRLVEKGLVPAPVPPPAGKRSRKPASLEAKPCVSVLSPAGCALEMETHVGKHTLLIGDAGGFVCAASNEGLYPGMWSAQIAAEVVAQALAARNSQDVLMQFESRWRSEMGEYLRMPNTDLQFLLPLIFSNQPMADRMGAAFFFGENI